MKSKENFIKLFDLNIPKIEYFDYYLLQMSKTQKYKNILDLYKIYNDCEVEIECTWDYRREKAAEISKFIESTNTYNEMCYDKSLNDYLTSKNIEYSDKLKYLSIDLRSSTWVALKKYDPIHINELGSTLEEFLTRFDLPKVFIESKYLRQFLFSKIDTKKVLKVQRNIIQEIVRDYQNELILEGVRNDEVIFSFENFSEITQILGNIDKKKYKTKIFSIEKIEDFRVDNYYSSDGTLYHREIVGVDPHLFFLNLKKYITGEKILLKDLFFNFAGNLAVWCDDNLKIEYND